MYLKRRAILKQMATDIFLACKMKKARNILSGTSDTICVGQNFS